MPQAPRRHREPASGREWSPPVLDLPPPPRPEIGLSRTDFLRAATETINDFGYHGASVDAIAARLNVTKGAFYHHISAKDDLVLSCFDRSFGAVRDTQKAALDAVRQQQGQVDAGGQGRAAPAGEAGQGALGSHQGAGRR